ncbi:VOC family protein [Virgisporangium aurantiacum]|uniref:VOC domain-containing protein n=1 Tax=Virgisporangium aurantiacum TaxID=175570 RepID=A0A8J4E354_9ACTN|nr:VOC family protein [Virgisporangium aurantiacum]GIJ57657.1 hypothetical protein Vau01_051730 [Virgisporangium aurantiacum]
MANGNRLSMSYGRRFMAIALGALGLFVVSYGIGFGNPGIMAVGVAVGVLGPALLILTAVRSAGRQYIFGTAHVYSASPPPSSGMVGRCELHLSVFAAGIDGVAVRVLDPAVPVSKWPDDGATLPVEVVANNPRKVRVLWDKVVTHAQAAGEDLYPQYVEDLPADLDDEFEDDLPADEFLDDLPPLPVGPPPTPPPNLPTSSGTIAAAGMDFAPVSAPMLVEPAAPPPPGAPKTKIVSNSAAAPPLPRDETPDFDEPDPAPFTPAPNPLGRNIRADRDRQNRAFVTETYDPDDEELHEYWRNPDEPDEPEAQHPPATAAPPVSSEPDDTEDSDLPDTAAGPVRSTPVANRSAPPTPVDDPTDPTDDDPPATEQGAHDRNRPLWAGTTTDDRPLSTTTTTDDPHGTADDRPHDPGDDRPRGTGWASRRGGPDDLDDDDRDGPGGDGPGGQGPGGSSLPGGASWGGRRGGSDAPDPGTPLAAEAGGPPVSLPLPRRRPSPHLRRPSPRQRKSADTETGEPRASSGINPVYVAEAPSEPPPDWPLAPQPDAQPAATPIRPESRPEPDHTEVVSGTVEGGYGEVLTGSIVDDHAYSDRSETDRMTFDRSSYHALEIDVPDTGPNGYGTARPAPRAEPARGGTARPAATRDEDPGDPFNVVPLRIDRDRAGAASNGSASRTEARDRPAPPEDAGSDDPETDDPETDEDLSGDAFLAAPSMSLSNLGASGVNVTLLVRDLSRSVAFYRDVLDLSEIETGKNSARLARGQSRLLLKLSADPGPADPGVVYLTLEVPDVQASYRELGDKGLDFVHPPRVVSHGEQLELWAATFHDPDGHTLAVTNWEIHG